MNRRTSLLLWLVIAGVAGAMLVQVFIARGELLQARADEVGTTRDLARAQAKLATATRSTARLEERLRAQSADPDPGRMLTSDEIIIESLRRKLAEMNALHAGEARPPPLTNPFGPNYTAENMADPAYAALFRTWDRMRLESEYNELFASGFVPPETMKRLSDLLVERQLAQMDAIALTGASRWGPSNPPTKEQQNELARIEQATSERFETEIRGLLGEEAFVQFRHFEQTMPLRREIATIAERFSYTDQPLTPVQRTRLLEIMDAPKLRPSGLLAGFSAAIDEAFAAKAAGVLTPGQLELLHQLQAEQRALQTR